MNIKQKISVWVESHRAWAHTLAVSAFGGFVAFASDEKVRDAVVAQLSGHPRIAAALTTAASWYLIYLKAKR